MFRLSRDPTRPLPHIVYVSRHLYYVKPQWEECVCQIGAHCFATLCYIRKNSLWGYLEFEQYVITCTFQCLLINHSCYDKKVRRTLIFEMDKNTAIYWNRNKCYKYYKSFMRFNFSNTINWWYWYWWLVINEFMGLNTL